MTHLRLPKSAKHCWEPNLAVPLPAARAFALALSVTLHSAGRGALPRSAPGPLPLPGPLDSETSHKCNQPLLRGKSDLPRALNFWHWD